MKNFKLHVMTLLLACVLFFTAIPSTALIASGAENEEGEFQVVVSAEGLTLGQGMYVEPTAYSLDEINELLGQQGYGPYEKEELTAAMVTLAMFIDKGLEYQSTGSWESDFYLSAVKDIDKGYTDIPVIITENGGPSNDDHYGNDDEYLGEFDYNFMSGWMITVNDFMINQGSAAFNLVENAGVDTCQDYDDTYVIRWHYTLCGYGADLGFSTGWGNDAYYEHANKDMLYAAYANSTDTAAKANALAVMENMTATQNEVDAATASLAPIDDGENAGNGAEVGNGTGVDNGADIEKGEGTESGANTDNEVNKDKEAQDVSAILNATLAQLAITVAEPNFGTTAGEWSVLSLARGEFFDFNDEYFVNYYDRIVATVNATAASVSTQNGALHKVKSTENSRLILALSAIGKDATSVGDWNLITPFEDFAWIKKQGINGPIFALIALDTRNYQTADSTIRQQCVDFILSNQLQDGGWALSGTVADTDITAMTLQALYNYRSQEAVTTAAEAGFACLSSLQRADGGYSSHGTINSESIAQVMVACTTWGINPDTDERFIKEGNSAVDALLRFYVEDETRFCHVMDGGSDAMATDQASYALVAYNRFLQGKNCLYDMTDVAASEVSSGEIVADITMPEKITNKAGTTFNAIISLKGWDNEESYKLMDAIVSVPAVLKVTNVTMGSAVSGGQLNYYLEESTGKLRLVYADLAENQNITVSGDNSAVEFINISFELTEDIDITQLSELNISLLGMSFKKNSQSDTADSMTIVNTANAIATTQLVKGITYSAMKLYTGDDVDLIGANQTAVTVAVTGVEGNVMISFMDGETEIPLLYNAAISEKNGVASYVCMVDSSMNLEELTKATKYKMKQEEKSEEIHFGDSNGDEMLNAQDALAAVNFWLRKSPNPDDRDILSMNINADSRLNTYDALGIVENFVNGDEFAIVNKIAALKSVVK